MFSLKKEYVWVILRLSMSWIFIWPFFDKLFGLGFATTPDKAWVLGNSPTLGFLKFATKGPFADFYQGLAGNPVIDWLFMLGLLFVGITLLLGVGVRLGSIAGIAILLLIYSSVLLPEHNPFLDDHIVYSLILLGFLVVPVGRWFGLGKWWAGFSFVKKYGILE